MSANKDLIRIFDQMAAALELTGANPFRVNAHSRVARVIRDVSFDLESFVKEEPDTALKRLQTIDGVGKGSAEKIIEFIETGRVREHQELLKEVPLGLFKILQIPGLGPKTVRLMWQELGITKLSELKAKLESPELAALPRMGKKTIDNIRAAIEFAEVSGGRAPIGLALPIARAFVERLRELPGVHRADFAGSLRRGRDTIGDIDILVACDDPDAVRECFCSHPDVQQVLAKGDTKCSVRLSTNEVTLQADLRIVPKEQYGAGLMYFSGSKEFNVRLREIAIKKKMRLNEYGLFEGTDERPQDQGATPLAGADEESIFQALGLGFVPPELREERWLSDGDNARRLVELADIKAELHSHTVASDGKLTIDELADAAKRRGLTTLAITDHSKSSVIANGLDEDRLRRHVAEIREANGRIEGIELLAGAEVDILLDGSLDYDDDMLAELDIVVASPHASLRQKPEIATKRLLAAVRHPLVHILGHPTGRIIGGREGLAPDMDQLIAAALEHDTALEINANWKRLDLRDAHVKAAVDAGCRIAINTDAHRDSHFDNLHYGVLTARRGGVRPEDCVNAWTTNELHAWLKSKR
ncbi:MAG: DNA polymerase/3'-5' exonuclease PolX [Phycisphaerales bacterium]